jgi:hypothetical protein
MKCNISEESERVTGAGPRYSALIESTTHKGFGKVGGD